jgi:acetylornithine deacetylase/succinyl-diaminopimelate desuccinylase-like protein
MKTNIPFLLLLAVTSVGQAAPPDVGAAKTEAQFREIYKELVETNTTLSSGSCTLAAERMANRLKQAGFADSDLHPFADPAHPKEGGLVAIYPGQDKKLKAILLLAHIDVVEAKREDWTRDPFKLVEENGSFYARGALDDKAEAAIWVDTLVRYRQESFKPRRTLKLALTCGEETAGAFNGAQWLTQNKKDLIDAELAINEGAGGELDAQGNRVVLQVQAGEKFPQNYRLEVTNKGGHSSRPVKDNAIYHLAGALKNVEAYEFPAQFTDSSRAYFTGMAKIQTAKGNREIADAMNALVKDPNDTKSIALVSAKDPSWNATMRTTCVATMLDGGHATNALPQRAGANINCRIFPGVSAESVRAKLEELAADPAVKVTTLETRSPPAPAPALTPRVLGPVQDLAKQFWPGVPVLPVLQAGATDGVFLSAIGIPNRPGFCRT